MCTGMHMGLAKVTIGSYLWSCPRKGEGILCLGQVRLGQDIGKAHISNLGGAVSAQQNVAAF